jgi:hypothetical protein
MSLHVVNGNFRAFAVVLFCAVVHKPRLGRSELIHAVNLVLLFEAFVDATKARARRTEPPASGHGDSEGGHGRRGGRRPRRMIHDVDEKCQLVFPERGVMVT